MINIIFIFSLIAGRDTLPPQVSGTFPLHFSEVRPYYSIYIGFTQEMDSSSFDSSAIEIHSSSNILPKVIRKPAFGYHDSLIIIWVYDYWRPFDTIDVRIKGYVKGKNGLTLDGNGNGIPEGSPIDDYVFKFFTSDYGFICTPKNNFPFLCEEVSPTYPHPDPGNLADIDKNGNKEIIYVWKGEGGIKVSAINKDAQLLPNFPVYLPAELYNSIPPSCVADLNKDGYYEIIPAACVTNNFHTAKFYVISYNGNTFPNWPQVYHNDTIFMRTPLYKCTMCYDFDQDGELEIIFPVKPNLLFIYEKDGSLWGNEPYIIPKIGAGPSTAIGDLNNDGIPEIILVTSSCQLYDTLKVYVLEPDGSPFPNFPKIFPNLTEGFTVVGDINSDLFLEIIFTANTDISQYPYVTGVIIAMDYQGNLLPGFPVTIQNEWFANSISLGDIDGDTIPEIICATAGQDWIPDLLVIKGDGTILPNFPIQTPGGSALYPPSAVDLDGDGYSEIILTTEGGEEIYIPNFSELFQPLTYVTAFSRNGGIIPGFPIILPSAFTHNTPLISDIENDGYADITVCAGFTIYSFNTPFETNNVTFHWAFPYHDIHNTSNYHYIPPEISVSELKSKYKHLLKFSSQGIVKNEFKFKLYLPSVFENKKLKILFYSVHGIKLKELDLGKFYKTNAYSIDIKNLKKGVYFYKLKINGSEILKGKFVKL